MRILKKYKLDFQILGILLVGLITTLLITFVSLSLIDTKSHSWTKEYKARYFTNDVSIDHDNNAEFIISRYHGCKYNVFLVLDRDEYQISATPMYSNSNNRGVCIDGNRYRSITIIVNGNEYLLTSTSDRRLYATNQYKVVETSGRKVLAKRTKVQVKPVVVIKKTTRTQKTTKTTKTTTKTSTSPVKKYRNCTHLRQDYPEGVSSSHSAYQSKFDRDKDGWACEVSR